MSTPGADGAEGATKAAGTAGAAGGAAGTAGADERLAHLEHNIIYNLTRFVGTGKGGLSKRTVGEHKGYFRDDFATKTN